MKKTLIALTVVAVGLFGTATHAVSTYVEGFDGGSDGGFIGNAFFDAAGGNPGGNAHHLGDFFFNDLRTGGIGEPANPNFLGDYSACTEATLSFDIKVDSLTNFFGDQIFRPIGIELRDRDIQGPSGDSGVYFLFDDPIGGALQPDWTTFSVTITDTTAAALPPGWIGFGDEDPMTFEPTLPPGATFATVLASVDQFEVTGSVPGFFFTFAGFDVRIDNIAVTCGLPAGACCTDGPGTASDCIEVTQDECDQAGPRGGLFLGPGTICGDVVDCVPLVVTMDSMVAEEVPGGVRLNWSTALEIDTAGFRVVRQTGNGREKRLDVLPGFIAATAAGLGGATYEYLDNSRSAGSAIYYYILDVDLFGRETMHGPIGVDRGARQVPTAPESRRSTQRR